MMRRSVNSCVSRRILVLSDRLREKFSQGRRGSNYYERWQNKEGRRGEKKIAERHLKGKEMTSLFSVVLGIVSPLVMILSSLSISGSSLLDIYSCSSPLSCVQLNVSPSLAVSVQSQSKDLPLYLSLSCLSSSSSNICWVSFCFPLLTFSRFEYEEAMYGAGHCGISARCEWTLTGSPFFSLNTLST